MAKVAKEGITLVSSAGTGYFYTLRKNKKKRAPGKLKLMKYDPVARKHVLFEEKKLSKVKEKFDREKFLASLEG